MEFLHSLGSVSLFGLIFARIIAFLSVVPILSSKTVSLVVRFSLALFTSICLFSLVNSSVNIPSEWSTWLYLAQILAQVLVGLILGFFVVLIYSIFQGIGSFLAYQFGFSMANVFDPLNNANTNILEEFFSIVAIFVFLSSQGFEKIFLYNLYLSFIHFPFVRLATPTPFIQFTLGLFGFFFQRAFFLALPIVGVLLIINIVLGLISKVVPQINLFVLGFPLGISVGLILLIVLIPLFIDIYIQILNFGFDHTAHFIQSLDHLAPAAQGGKT